jgi:hypothetical protein
MRGVMPRMPRQCGKNIFDSQGAAVGMEKLAFPILGRERFIEQYDSTVDTVQDPQRWFDVAGAAIVQLGPKIFVVRADGRLVFRQRKFGADIPVEVRIGQMVHNLTNGPSTSAVRRIELGIRQIRDCRSQLRRRFRHLREVQRAILRGKGKPELKWTDGVSCVGGGHCHTLAGAAQRICTCLLEVHHGELWCILVIDEPHARSPAVSQTQHFSANSNG